jgi:hypothetical protein
MNVYNMTISKQTLNHTCTVDLSGLQSGLYYMTFRQKQNLATKRILIQK